MDNANMPGGPAARGAAMAKPEAIYHIALGGDWSRALKEGTYAGGAADLADGFIHFSTKDQVAATLARHFGGRGGLVLLSARVASLGDRLRWEAAPMGGVFPHYHGTLPADRLRLLGPIVLGGDGRHIPPFRDGAHVPPFQGARP